MTIAESARALRRRETSARELTETALRRARELDPTLNAFVLIDEEGPARRRAGRRATRRGR